MLDPKKDPRRRCMRLAEWPAADQEAWNAATRLGDPFDEYGLAANWRDGTKRKVIGAYGRYLTFLQQQNLLDSNICPSDRITPDLLRGYVDELREQVSSVTLAGRITDLREAVRIMAPGREFPFLDRAQQVLSARASPSRDKRRKYIPPATVFARVLELLDRIEQEPCRCRRWRATRYRDVLLLAILIARAPRRANLCAMVVGQRIHKAGERYVIQFEAEETKGNRPLEETLPAPLTPFLDRYLAYYRPMLLAGRANERLWISNLGTEMCSGTLYDRVRELTEREFGIACNPHSFRDGLATSLAIDDPKHVWAASAILGHADPRVTERHYNLARGIEAVRDHQENLRELRKSLRRTKVLA